MATKLYEVSMKKTFKMPFHHRAGLRFERGETRLVELTQDQVEAIKNDGYMDIKKPSQKAADQAADAPEREEQVSNSSTEGSSDEAPEAPGEEDQVQDSGDQEDAGSEDEGAEEAPAEDAGSEDSTDSEGSETETEEPQEKAAEEQIDEAPEAPSVDDLVRDNSREELNTQAVEAGVEAPEQLQNKQEVAEAIVAKRGE